MGRNNFDGLRLLGALMVVFHHQFAVAGIAEPSLFGVTLGAAGVVLFFSISGYLITQSWQRDPHVLRFAARRLLRVWPGMALVVIVSYGVILNIDFADPMASLQYRTAAEHFLVTNLVFDHWDWAFFPRNFHHVLNAPLWTISYEVACYGLVAAAGLVMTSRLPRTVSTAIVVVALGALALSGAAGDLWSLGSYFAAGAVMRLVPRRGIAIVIAAAVLAMFAVSDIRFGLHMLIPVLVVPIGLKSWPVLRDAGRFGDLSYGVYLWGWPIQQVGVLWLGRETPVALMLGLTLVFVLPIAWLSWHLVEKQAMRLKPRAQGASGQILPSNSRISTTTSAMARALLGP